jgi:hypothetical protein
METRDMELLTAWNQPIGHTGGRGELAQAVMEMLALAAHERSPKPDECLEIPVDGVYEIIPVQDEGDSTNRSA